MGTINSSFNLSDILSAFSSTQGINVQAAVAAAIAAESGPLTQMQNQQAALASQTSDLNVVEGHVQSLETALNALGDPAGQLMSMTASSSNSNVVSATASPGAAPGNHVVVVNNVASTASWYSDSVASSSTPLPSGSFTFQVGSNTPVQVTIGGSVDTMDQLASYINGLNAGVTANVVNDSTGSRLSIVANSSGAANNISITNATGVTFTQASSGADASLTIDGIPIDSASNTFAGVVPGVTFNLVSAAPNTQVNVSTSEDVTQASAAVTSFVTAYNQVVSDINQEYTVGANGVQGPLSGDPTLSILQSQLLGSGAYSTTGTNVSTLADLGITMNDDGSLTLDSTTLDSALQSNFSAVQNFFQGTAFNGFVTFLNNQLNALTDPTNGAFTVDLQSISNENSDLQDQINNFEDYLQSQTTLLTNEYNQADALLQQLPTLEAQINAELGNSTTTTTGS
ncbi:MAG TPA: flagellar filament capping protein FliD [Terriglobales bacterium]|nr:flagellar filament capping protein FliD [Terriglobales bacterium]